jgi:membrane-bound lytic murein transglycosylase B
LNRRRLLHLVCAALAASLAPAAAAPVAEAPEPPAVPQQIAQFVDEMVERHGFDRAALHALFAKLRPQPRVLAAMDAQVRPQPWFQYRPIFVNRARIDAGLRFWREHEALLERARAEFGLPEEMIVATLGIETFYGRHTGTHPVLDALAALAFEYPRRAAFFRGELEAFLLLARDDGFDPAAIRGSFAGALGLPQFMPSSWRKWAVDFDGDGRIDLWKSAADAIGSVANYYRVFGWVSGGPVAARVEAGAEAAEPQLKRGIQPHSTVAELRDAGLPLAAGAAARIDANEPAAVFQLVTRDGPQVWLGFHNFFVITRYNRSVLYAMAKYELAGELRRAREQGAVPAAAPPPRVRGAARAPAAPRRRTARR